MNRWISKVVTVASVVGALAVGVGGVALANEQNARRAREHDKRHHGGLVQAALKLDSLKPEQRSQIEQIEVATQGGRGARAPGQRGGPHRAREAGRAGSHRPRRPQGSLTVEEAAAQAARNVDVNTLVQLHGLLSAQQRNQLVDGLEARIPAGKPRPEHLESFRGDTFDASAMTKVHVPAEHAIAMAEKKVPSMSPGQRSDSRASSASARRTRRRADG